MYYPMTSSISNGLVALYGSDERIINNNNNNNNKKARQHKGLMHILSQQLSVLLNNTLKKPQTMVDKVFLS